MDPMETMAKGSQGRFLSALASASHIFVLTGFAVAQPLFDLLSRQAEFFIAHDAQPIDLLLMALALSFLLPLALVLLARSAALLGATAGGGVHCALVAGLSGLVALQLLGWLAPSLGPRLSVAAAVAVVMAGAILYRRWNVCRTFLTILSPTALLFPLLFLFGSPVRELVLPSTVAGGRRAAGRRRAGRDGGPRRAAAVVFARRVERGGSRLAIPTWPLSPGIRTGFATPPPPRPARSSAVPIIVSGRIPGNVADLLPQATDHPENSLHLARCGRLSDERFRVVGPDFARAQLCSTRPTARGLGGAPRRPRHRSGRGLSLPRVARCPDRPPAGDRGPVESLRGHHGRWPARPGCSAFVN